MLCDACASATMPWASDDVGVMANLMALTVARTPPTSQSSSSDVPAAPAAGR